MSSSTPGTSAPRRAQAKQRTARAAGGAHRTAARERAGVRVRRLERGADDGYRSPLALGLRSSVEAERLADEIAFAATRLRALSERPPGLYGEVAMPGDLEERSWLAFLIAYLGPLEQEDPFAYVREVRTSWASGQTPDLQGARSGPRAAHDPRHPSRTIEGYRSWARRAGSQTAAFTGDDGWTPERRFARVYERLALPGLHRDARFDLLVTMGWLGLFELRPAELMLGGSDAVTVAAKRILGIGDRLLLEGRAANLAETCKVPLAALDLALYNWEQGERVSLGLVGIESDAEILISARDGLGL